MKSGQATGCFTSIPVIVFIAVVLLFHIHLHWLVWISIVFILSQTLGLAFHGDSENNNEPKWNNESDDIQGATVTQINNHTVQISAKGKKFLIWKDQKDIAWFQELDSHGIPIGNKVMGAGNANRFGTTTNKSLADYIKRKINSGR